MRQIKVVAGRTAPCAPKRVTPSLALAPLAISLLLAACSSDAKASGKPDAAAAGPAPLPGASESRISGAAALSRESSLPPGVMDLCAGAGIATKERVAYSAAAKPAKGHTVTDPDFGTTIRRVTDVQGDWSANVAVPAYPTIPAWNADESLLVVYVTHTARGAVGLMLLDGHTYAFKKRLAINPADIEQFYWDRRDPDLMYYVANTQTGRALVRFHVSREKTDVVHDFSRDIDSGALKSACARADLVSGGSDPFFMSYDNDLIGLGCRLPYNGPHGASMFQAFSYRISTNTLGQVFANEAVVPQAMPSGKTTFFYKDGKIAHVLDPVTNAEVRSLPWNGGEHSDMLVNGAGDDVVAGAQYDGPSGSGTLMVANLSKGGVTTIIGEANRDPYPPTGTLVSGKAFKQPGWVAVGVTGTDVAGLKSTYLAQEILLANVDTRKFCRLAHHRSFGYDGNSRNQSYWAQPNVIPSPSGTRILFPSDWGGGPTIDTYVIELPAYKR